MKMIKNIAFYLLVIAGSLAVVYLIVVKGENLESVKTILSPAGIRRSDWSRFLNTFHGTLEHPLAILLLQIITIIIITRILGFLCKKISQPLVIGEIIAGILLGPSLLGTFFPGIFHFLFPPDSLSNLQLLSQVGLILFMFVVGMELDLKVLRSRVHEAVVISHASIIIPFTLGIGLAYFIYLNFAPANVKFLPFALFVGIAMSITAFPVLARIVQEKNMSRSRLGTIVITCAAADDITAWCLLAAIIAITKAGGFVSSLYTIFLAVIYVFTMIQVVRPFLKKIGEIYSSREGLSKPIVAIFFIILLLSSFTTEAIGIHALFGAFMAGVIMPAKINFRNLFMEKVEDIALVLLLPLFFVFTGLRTQIGLLNNPYLWKICVAVILVAITGKFLGSTMAAKFIGQNWHDSLFIGALMNTRGLIELVVLNIGYDLGVLPPQLFTMMVIMALVTTFMTAPMLNFIDKIFPMTKPAESAGVMLEAIKYKILISFGNPQSGIFMLKIAKSLIRNNPAHSSVTALHLTPADNLTPYNLEEYERDSFQPIIEESHKINLPIDTIFQPTEDIDGEIAQHANSGKYDLMIVGIGRSVYEGTLIGKILGFTTKMIYPDRLFETLTGRDKQFTHTLFDERTKSIIKNVKIPVVIMIDKELKKAENVVMPVYTENDQYLMEYAQKLIQNNDSVVSILDEYGVVGNVPAWKEKIRLLEQTVPSHIALFNGTGLNTEFINHQDIVLVSQYGWRKAIETKSPLLSGTPSVLILKP